ncbi:MAG: DUF4157 domain-containing protein [Terracidiphilus sp.]
MPLQRHAEPSASPTIVPPIVDDVLRSPGQPLDADTRAFMEPRFRHDFSHVRVHSNERAAESTQAVNALAYTVGSNIVFGAGRYSPASRSGRRLLAHELTHVVQQQNERISSPQYRLEVGPSEDRFERQADQVADRIAGGMEASQEGGSNLPPTHVAPFLQRAAATASAAPVASDPKATPGPERTTQPLLVEDDARGAQPGQMRKGDFLDKLQVSVCATADEVLSSVGRSAQGCPYIERWIAHFRMESSQHVERAILKYAPESAGARKAEDYIPFVAARVRRGVARWARTGEITEVPDELKRQLMGADLLAAVDRPPSGIGGAHGGAVSTAAGGVKNVSSASGGVLAKERGGGVRDAGDPQELPAQLGSGHSLDGGVKSRMETALGGDFSHVRVHTDSSAAELSTRLNARAFTIGRDVAFGAGEYRPGTLIGDALIAHELAHVVQQGGRTSSVSPMSRGATEYSALEEDADASAVGAVLSLWSGSKADLKDMGKNAMPRLRSGLGLQRCSRSGGGGGGALSVDKIDVLAGPAGAATGFAAITSGNLDSPGPWNDPAGGGVSRVLQVHFHADKGDSSMLTPRREIQRSAWSAGVESKKPPDRPAPPGPGGLPTPGGFNGVLVGPDGPGAHEVKRPTTDKIVVADAPGAASLTAAQFPFKYQAHFKVFVADSAGADIASASYDVEIEKTNNANIPNTKNSITPVEKKDIVRGKTL